jgi:signal transduction histidine kinase
MVEQPSILIIEDEPRLRQNLRILLQAEGYMVATAENGAEGIQAARQLPFDLVITDVVMPEADGFQVMEYLKDHCPDTVVVAITAYVSTSSAIEALRKGAYDYLAKPFDVELMLIVIRRALEKARMQKAFRHHMGELERQVEERTHNLTEANKRLQRSLTDLRAAQEQLVQTEKLRALGELTAVVTHELRDPLATIVSFAQLLARIAPAQGRMKAQLEHISEAASHCHHIVNSLYNYTWKQHPRKVYADLNEICENMLSSLAYQVNLSNIVVHRRLATNISRTMLDPNQLQHAFINIALNAYQAMISARSGGEFVIETRQGTGVIHLIFQDNGPGIAEEDQGRIFEPFFSTKPYGTGLGLSLASAIIEGHGGKITVSSILGEGTTFHLELPVIEPTQLQEEQLFGTSAPPDRARVLVIDDDEENCALLQEIVSHLGHEVEAVFSVEEALGKMIEQEYDVLIADLGMPYLTGEPLYQQIKALRPELAERTIFMSGDSISDDYHTFLEQQGCPVVRKPFSIPDIEARIKQMNRRPTARPPSVNGEESCAEYGC